MTAELILVKKLCGECGAFARVAPEIEECPSCGAILCMPNAGELGDFKDDEYRAEIRRLSEQLRIAKSKAAKFDELQQPGVQAMTVATALRALEDRRFERLIFNIAALDPSTPDPKTALALVITLARAAMKGMDVAVKEPTS